MRSPARATFSPNASRTTPTFADSVRDITRADGVVKSRVTVAKEGEVSKFQDYYDFSQPLAQSAVASACWRFAAAKPKGFLFWSSCAPAERLVGVLEPQFVDGQRAR